MPDGKYYIQLCLISPSNLLLQEMVLSPEGENTLFRFWTFKKTKEWDVLSLEKNKKHVYLRDLVQELEDLSRRMVLIQRMAAVPGVYYQNEVGEIGGEMELPEIPVKLRGLDRAFQWFRDFSLKPAFYMPILLGALVLVLLVGGIYTIRVAGLNRRIDGSIGDYITSLENQLENLHNFRASAEEELENLKDYQKMEKADLEFNRHNAHVTILRLREELPASQVSRREAYRLIASNVKDAVSFGEIIYEMSRLPNIEYQARVFLSTDKKAIIPLGHFEPVFSGMAYPVCLDGAGNDGMGFRVSDGFMDKREDPLGSGGVFPHYAIDIVNVANISHISYGGEIVRTGNDAGNVVAVESGIVKTVGFNDEFGWHLEIEHPLSAEIKEKFPQATGWTSYYAHMVSEPNHATGDWVEKSASLGKIGNTGRSTGPHLHFEVRVFLPKGKYWDPSGRFFDKVDPFPSQRN